MSIDLDEHTITEAVQRTFDNTPDERTKQVFRSLLRHLHDFVRDVRLTDAEWFTAMDFLVRVGQKSSPTRQEFILLSDVLGLSVLVDVVNHHRGPFATESTLLGPFFIEDRPRVPNGADISGEVAGVPLFVSGKVVDPDGRPVAGAHVDTWHSDGDGLYDVQMEDLHGRPAMRGLLSTESDGRFWYRSIAPKYYPIPVDGPVGEIMRAAERSIIRPEHIHFWIHAPGYQDLITMLFRGDDTHLNEDPVFGAKRSLVVDFVRHEPGSAPDGTTVDVPFQTVEWTFVLVPETGRAGRA